MEGKVFTVMTDDKGLAKVQNSCRVTNIQKTEKGIRVRVLCAKAPSTDFEAVKPTLEDYYLHIFGEGSDKTEA